MTFRQKYLTLVILRHPSRGKRGKNLGQLKMPHLRIQRALKDQFICWRCFKKQQIVYHNQEQSTSKAFVVQLGRPPYR